MASGGVSLVEGEKAQLKCWKYDVKFEGFAFGLEFVIR